MLHQPGRFRVARLSALASGLLVAALLSVVPAAGSPAGPSTGVSDVSKVAGVPEAGPTERTGRDPRRTRGLFVDPLMPAAQATQSDAVFAPIGRTPQALWITDYYSVKGVRRAVADYVRRAEKADKTPMLAIYAIPGRDCGLFSSGGMPNAKTYRKWVRRAAAGLKGSSPLVVLEPDAVPFMGDRRCVAPKPRQRLLKYAVKRLTRAGAWVYIDAGHSDWRSPADMARLLKRSGIKRARGFSTNVGNFRRTKDEHAYARAVVRELRKRKVRKKRYVIETARNGAARPPADGDVCNPVEARLGRYPVMRFRKRFDGFLWIKHPGESDGQSTDDTCHGGPPSGQWWPAGALALMGR